MVNVWPSILVKRGEGAQLHGIHSECVIDIGTFAMALGVVPWQRVQLDTHATSLWPPGSQRLRPLTGITEKDGFLNRRF